MLKHNILFHRALICVQKQTFHTTLCIRERFQRNFLWIERKKFFKYISLNNFSQGKKIYWVEFSKLYRPLSTNLKFHDVPPRYLQWENVKHFTKEIKIWTHHIAMELKTKYGTNKERFERNTRCCDVTVCFAITKLMKNL